jgi:hypothetical protein
MARRRTARTVLIELVLIARIATATAQGAWIAFGPLRNADTVHVINRISPPSI